MLTPRTPEEAQAVLAREARVFVGPVAAELDGVSVPPGRNRLTAASYLLHADSGSRYHYQRGQAVTVQHAPGADPAEDELWLNGSVYSAIASLNGFMPLHASAVACDGRVFAFTGPGGAGKSTLAAGLGGAGLPLFCDDTLLVDLAASDQAVAMPGHKRLKLRPDALALTGAQAIEPVGAATGKNYAQPLAGVITRPLPLDTLVLLEDGPDLRLDPLRGALKFALLDDDHHTQATFQVASGLDRAGVFAVRARIARQVRMFRLERPRSAAGFAASCDFMARQIREWAGGPQEGN